MSIRVFTPWSFVGNAGTMGVLRFPAMHHPHSTTAILRLRLAALLLVGNYMIALAAAGLLVQSAANSNQRMMMTGAGLLVLVLLMVVVQWIAASRACCPLCRTPVLSPKRCSKHRNARPLLGSHRLRVAAGILTRNQFRCPYCNEPTAMKVRETSSGGRVGKGWTRGSQAEAISGTPRSARR